jgi:hypothetical protein
MQTTQDPALKPVLSKLLWGVPLVCSLVQLAAWSRYNLHGGRLVQVRLPHGAIVSRASLP